MKKHNPLGLTPEELAELEAFDAEVDQDDELTVDEITGARRRDRELDEKPVSRHALYQREYNRKHREKRRVQAREYYYANLEKNREKCRQWYANHTEHRKEYSKAYSREHKAEYLAKEKARTAIWAQYGQQIKEAREARGWSQNELGKRLGIKRQVVWKYESGRRQIDWERFRAVMPEIGPQPEGYPARRTRAGRPRQEEEVSA